MNPASIRRKIFMETYLDMEQAKESADVASRVIPHPSEIERGKLSFKEVIIIIIMWGGVLLGIIYMADQGEVETHNHVVDQVDVVTNQR